MKLIQLAGVVLLVLVLASCKKDGDDNAAVTVPGYWKGWWSAGAGAHQNMVVLFREGGSARVIYGFTTDTATAGFKAEGAYELSGNVLRFTYMEASNIFIHKSNLSNNMSGTWGHAPSETNGGLFGLNKQ